MYAKILVPVDGTETSTLGLNEAIKMAKIHRSQIRLVNVVNEFVFDCTYSPGAYAASVMESLRQGGQAILDIAKAAAQRQGITPECVLLESTGGPAAELILEQAKDWSAELIVMGTHGRRGLMRVALGSDAEQVVRAAAVPVLLVRGPGAHPRSMPQIASAA